MTFVEGLRQTIFVGLDFTALAYPCLEMGGYFHRLCCGFALHSKRVRLYLGHCGLPYQVRSFPHGGYKVFNQEVC